MSTDQTVAGVPISLAIEYEILERLGAGAHGTVFKARRKADGIVVAIKLLTPFTVRDDRARVHLQREYQILHGIQHIGLARAHSLHLDDSACYLVRDFVSGISVDELIGAVGPLPPEEVRSLAIQVCSVMEVVHGHGVIHRDIKPENLLITERGPVITDFGLGLVMDAVRITGAGEFVGSVETSSPEQLLGRQMGPASDIYSLGATLYYMATGYSYLPFTSNLATNIRLVVDRWGVTAPHVLNRGIPVALSKIILKCLDPDPSSRYHDMGELKSVMEGVAVGDELPAVAAGRLEIGIPRRARGVIPSGSLALDLALGTGGWPRGRVSELYGPEGCGKTTLAMHLIAQAQRLGGSAALIDADQAIDPYIAERCGVDIDSVYFMRPSCLEEALTFAEELVKRDIVDAIVIDSIAALLPRRRLEQEIGDAILQNQAHDNDFAVAQPVEEDPLLSQIVKDGFRRILPHLARSRATLMVINQLDVRFGVMFGNPETTSFGTRAIGYYSSLRVDLRRIQSIKVGQACLGSRVRVTVKKNRLAAPFRQAEFDMMFSHGISREADILDVAVTHDVVQKRQGYFQVKSLRLGKTREEAVEFLREHDDLCNRLERAVRLDEPLEISESDKQASVIKEGGRVRRRAKQPHEDERSALDEQGPSSTPRILE